MRLVNTITLRLEDPRGSPRYAILSHVWGDEEATFREFNENQAVNSNGYAKIKKCCARALADGYKYVWIDTCCIDKSSSAELSEAINSMYRWYEEAYVCYVYLEDVPSNIEPAFEGSQFWYSKWFTRGWTLQELIAPGKIIFFAKDWVEIGSRESLIPAIAQITGVDERVLLGTLRLTEVSVAKKMAWASLRETTRVEDRAYSLMGIFGVHMPLIYGEGANAFTRLQHEIMRTSNDQSIFAWGCREQSSRSGVLASSPSDFYGSHKIDRIAPADFRTRLLQPTFTNTEHKSHFSLSNSGIQISLPVKRQPHDSPFYTAVLACSDGHGLIGLTLLRCGDNLFERAQNIHSPIVHVSTPDDHLFVRDMFLATEGRSLLPESGHVVYIHTTQIIQEGFLLHGHSPQFGKNLRMLDSGICIWNPTTSNAHCSLAHRNKAGDGGFVFTIGGISRRPCVHIDEYPDISRMEDTLSSYRSNNSPCHSHPNWGFKNLQARKRVTVTTWYWEERLAWVVSVSVSYPKSAWTSQPNERPTGVTPSYHRTPVKARAVNNPARGTKSLSGVEHRSLEPQDGKTWRGGWKLQKSINVPRS